MSSGSRRVTYFAALDGLRGVCLLGVLLFHAPFTWMPGGFLGVSAFFTLSGYLITTLLIAEWDDGGGIDFGGFWRRRMRRLAPALWLAVAAILATSRWWIGEAARGRLTWDALSSLAFLSNWRFMSPEYAYSRLFADPSVLQHTWSLSIEAQYYLFYPALFALLMRYAGRRDLALVVLGLALISFLICALAASGAESTYRSYYGTDARVGEILAGVFLALARAEGWLDAITARRALVSVLGVAALVCMIASWATFTVSTPWLYRGGFLAHALLATVVVLAATVPAGALSSLLSVPLLSWLGRISYGAYVYHWPIFLFLDEERLALGLSLSFVVKLAATLLCAWASYRFFEEPIRYRRESATKMFRWAAVASVFVLALAGLQDPRVGYAWQEWREDDVVVETPLAGGAKFALFGDSAAMTLLPQLKKWLPKRGFQTVEGSLNVGCAMVEDGRILSRQGWLGVPRKCRRWVEEWGRRIRQEEPDFAVVLTGSWDILDRRLPGDDKIRTFGDPIYERLFRFEVADAIKHTRAAAVHVLWLTYPYVRFEAGQNGFDHVRASDPNRVRRHNEILREVAADYPGWMTVIDFATYMKNHPMGTYAKEIRHDGVHFTHGGGKFVTEEFIGPALLDASKATVALRPGQRR